MQRKTNTYHKNELIPEGFNINGHRIQYRIGKIGQELGRYSGAAIWIPQADHLTVSNLLQITGLNASLYTGTFKKHPLGVMQ